FHVTGVQTCALPISSSSATRQGRSASGFCRNNSGPDVTRFIVLVQPGVKIGLQLVERRVHLLAECHPVELIECGLMEALADAVRSEERRVGKESTSR